MNGSLAGFEERRLAELKEHVAARARRPHRRRRFVLAATAGAVAATVAGVLVLSSVSGGDPAYAVTKDADGVVYVTVRDFRDAAGLTGQLRSLGVPAVVDYVPAGRRCEGPRGVAVRDVPRGLYHAPANIPGEDAGAGWRMRIDTKLFEPGQTFVWTLEVDPVHGWNSTSTILMRDPVAPCELVPDDSPHVVTEVPFAQPPSLDGYRVEGRTVGEVLPEIHRRGLKAAYLVTEPAPGDSPDDLYVMYPTGQGTPVGADWFVWQADEPEEGVIRLMVTRKLREP